MSHPLFIRRFNTEPESGRLKGLSLMLDAHSDRVASSSITDDFQVRVIQTGSSDLRINMIFCIFKGFTAVVDSRKQYPLTTRKSVMIRPGYSVKLFHYKNLLI